MENVTCPKCGRVYPRDAKVCPGCKQSNEAFYDALPQDNHPPVKESLFTKIATKSAFLTVFLLTGGVVLLMMAGGIFDLFGSSLQFLKYLFFILVVVWCIALIVLIITLIIGLFQKKK